MTEQRLSTHISASQHDFGKRTKAKGFEQNSRRSAKKKKSEDPSEFLGRIYQTYRHCTNADPKAPAHILVVNLILGVKYLR